MLSYADKKRALRDYENIVNRKTNENFNGYSQAIFASTDNIPAILQIKNDIKKAMIPASSGEGAIELASKGIDVYTYDISSTSYYTEQLRIAATKMLEYKELLAFFYMFEEKEILSEKYYEKLREGLEPRAQYLLDKMFSSMKSVEVFDKLYDMLRLCPSFLNRPTYYLELAKQFFSIYNEEGFYQAKNADLQSKIHYAQFNILDLSSSDYKDEKDFDLIFFSNIMYSLSFYEKFLFMNMLKNTYSYHLKDGGILVNYFHSLDGLPRHLKIRDDDMLYHDERTTEAGLLSSLSDNFHNIGKGINGMGPYQNDIVHLIKKV